MKIVNGWTDVEIGDIIKDGDCFVDKTGFYIPVELSKVGLCHVDRSQELRRPIAWEELPPESVTRAEEGRKDDTGKLPWDLLPVEPVEEIIEVLQFGAQKYGAYNWQKVERPFHRYFATLCRHIFAWWKGEGLDQESGKSHLAHAGCCILFLLWFARNVKR